MKQMEKTSINNVKGIYDHNRIGLQFIYRSKALRSG